MIDMINKSLLIGNEFLPEMHLRQPRVHADYISRTISEYKNSKL